MNIVTTNDLLTVALQGLEHVWALKGSVRLPAVAIDKIEYTTEKPGMRGLWSYVRFPGTAIPGVFLAGTYIKRGSREFWYILPGKPGLLTITLKKDMARYDKVRLTASADTANTAMSWWSGRQ